MGATRSGIHLRRSNRPIALAFFHFFFDSLIAVNWMFGQVLDIHAELFMLANL